MLKLQTLGRLDLRDSEGRSVQSLLAQPKAMAVLVYLVLARPRGFQRRDAVCALFWPESDESHARGALSQALSRIRRSLGGRALETRGNDELRVASGTVESDVVGFEAALEAGDSAAALALYRGPFLAGFQVSDAPGFDRWLDTERDRLRGLASRSAWALALERLAAGEISASVGAAERALDLDPTDESSARSLMEALAGSGERVAALRVYERLAVVLAAELEVVPSPETLTLAETLHNGVVARAEQEPGEPGGLAAGRGSASGAPDGDPAWASPTAGTRGGGRATRAGERRWPRWLAALGAGLVVVTVALVGYGMLRDGTPTLIDSGLAGKYDGVVVADFSAPDPDLGMAVAEWVRASLDQSDIVRPVGPAVVGNALQRMKLDRAYVDAVTAREIAVRDGYPLVVAGELAPVGDEYLITVRLESADGEVLARFTAGAPVGPGLVDVLDRLGDEIRTRIGDSAPSIHRSPRLQQVTTASLEALELYTAALRRGGQGRREEAFGLLERAVAVDSTFAAAYLAMAAMLNTDMIQWDRITELRRKAYAHRDRLTEYERLRVEDYWAFQQQLRAGVDECGLYLPSLELEEAYVARHPDDPRPWPSYGVSLDRAGRGEEALEVWRRARSVDPTDQRSQALYAYSLARARRLDEALEALEEWRSAGGETANWVLARAWVVGRTGDYARTDSLLADYINRFGEDADVMVVRGQLDAVRGRLAEARDHYARAMELWARTGDLEHPVVWVADLGFQQLLLEGDPDGAVERMAGWLERIPPGTDLGGSWVNVGLLYAMAGDLDRAHRAADTLVVSGMGQWSLVRGPLAAAIALAEEDPSRALQDLRESEIPCTFNFVDHRVDRRWRWLLAARAHEALGQPDSAVVAYQGYLAEPPRVFPVSLDALFRFDVLARLGQLLEDRGDRAAAALRYGEAAALWNEADPLLQPRVRSVRERAEALSGTDRAAHP